MPSVSGVVVTIDDWPTAMAEVSVTNTNNNPVFFILPPPLNGSNSALAIFLLSLWEDKGYSKKVTTAPQRVKVTRVFRPFALSIPANFPHPYVASVRTPL